MPVPVKRSTARACGSAVQSEMPGRPEAGIGLPVAGEGEAIGRDPLAHLRGIALQGVDGDLIGPALIVRFRVTGS